MHVETQSHMLSWLAYPDLGGAGGMGHGGGEVGAPLHSDTDLVPHEVQSCKTLNRRPQQVLITNPRSVAVKSNYLTPVYC